MSALQKFDECSAYFFVDGENVRFGDAFDRISDATLERVKALPIKERDEIARAVVEAHELIERVRAK